MNVIRAFSISSISFVLGGALLHGQVSQPSGVPSPLPGTAPGVMNQPVVVSSFEGVEMRRLEMAENAEKAIQEDREFQAKLVLLQKKLLGLSQNIAAPENLSTEYRTFISTSAGDVDEQKKYYELLKAALNDLTPVSPYRPNANAQLVNQTAAAEKLVQLAKFETDEGISNTLLSQIEAVRGGVTQDAARVGMINKRLAKLKTDLNREQWNDSQASQPNGLTGRPSATPTEQAAIKLRIAEIQKEQATLEAERGTLSHTVTKVQRQLQFQQYIVQLAMQRRYIHSLMACGFYRYTFAGADLAISKAAFPNPQNVGGGAQESPGESSGQPGFPSAGGSSPVPASNPIPVQAGNPAVNFPVVDTITSMETVLLNRIRDAIKDRDALDNMLKVNQMAAAAGQLERMVITGKYQPELNTLAFEERQRIFSSYQDLRELSDMLTSKNYQEIDRLAKKIEQSSQDARMGDVKSFAAEQPKRALFWLDQAELALQAGDVKSMQKMKEVAMNRAPFDPEVEKRLKDLQSSVISSSKVSDELERIIKDEDYQAAARDPNKYVVAAASDPALRAGLEKLLERDKSVQKVIEKCDVFEQRSSYADAWICLSEVEPAVANDPRLTSRMTRTALKCSKFVDAYDKAIKHEKNGESSLALAWYLTALAEAPTAGDLVKRINTLGEQVLKQ